MRSTTGSHTDTRCSITTSVAPVSSATRATASRTSRDAGGIEVRRRLVEQDEARAHREHAGQRESLPLPARERGGRRDRAAGRGRPRRAPRATRGQISSRGDAEVLESERHVVAEPRHHHLRVGILQHEAGAAARRGGRPAVDEQLADRLARRRRRRARPRARAAGSTCPTPTRRAAAPAPPAGCRGRGRARRASRRPPWRQPQPRAVTDAGRGVDASTRRHVRPSGAHVPRRTGRARPARARPRTASQDEAAGDAPHRRRRPRSM